MRFSGHDYHHRYHRHQQDAYGPSRIQDYIQPSQPFYGYNQSYQHQLAYNSSQNYVNSFNFPHRAPIPSEFAHTAGPGYTHMLNRQGPFRVGFVENQQHSNLGWSFTVADKMNPLAVSVAAAVAAPSQLTQIAGSMDAAQRATNAPIGQSLYIGPGGRGDISFRGVRWGQFNHSGPSLYHGRGHGRGGGGRQIPPRSSRPTNSQVASAPVAAGAASVVQSVPSVPQQKPLLAPATAGASSVVQSVPSVPQQKPLPAPATAGATSVVQSVPSVPQQKPLPAPATAGASSVVQSVPSVPQQKPLPAPATAGATSVVQSVPSVPQQKPLPAPDTAGASSVVQPVPSVPQQKPLPAPATAGATSVVQSVPSVPQQKPLPAPATAGATSVVQSVPSVPQQKPLPAPATAGATSVVQSVASVPQQKPLPAPATAGATSVVQSVASVPQQKPLPAPATAGASSVVQSVASVPQQKPLPAPATAGATQSSRPTNSQVASAPVTAAATSVVQCAPSAPGQKPLPTLAQVPSAPLQSPQQNAWCEICKVHCGVPAKLEEHKNGKRHKKKLSAQGKLKILKAADVQQSEQMPTSQSNSAIHPGKIQELEKKGCLTENIVSETTVDNQQGEIELQKETAKNLEVPAEEPEVEPRDNSELKIRGRGGKYMKSDDGSRRPVEFPQSTQAPFICELCNVKCDSESLGNEHMNGKRHKKNLKRASRGLQALYPPDANAVANLVDFLVERGISNPQILSAQLVIRSVLSQTQKPGISSPSGPLATPIQVSPSVSGSGFEPESTCLADTNVRGHGTCKE